MAISASAFAAVTDSRVIFTCSLPNAGRINFWHSDIITTRS